MKNTGCLATVRRLEFMVNINSIREWSLRMLQTGTEGILLGYETRKADSTANCLSLLKLEE